MFAVQHFGKCRVLHLFMTPKQHEDEKKKRRKKGYAGYLSFKSSRPQETIP